MVRKYKKSASLMKEIYQTENQDIKCTKLPEFIRAKKYLGGSFCVYFQNNIVPDNCKITITAGNLKNPHAELRNNEAFVRNGIAEFPDLRFLGKSGRGTRFNVYINAHVNEQLLTITYPNAIKVTVDGPRPPRIIKEKLKSNSKNYRSVDLLKKLNTVHEKPSFSIENGDDDTIDIEEPASLTTTLKSNSLNKNLAVKLQKSIKNRRLVEALQNCTLVNSLTDQEEKNDENTIECTDDHKHQYDIYSNPYEYNHNQQQNPLISPGFSVCSSVINHSPSITPLSPHFNHSALNNNNNFTSYSSISPISSSSSASSSSYSSTCSSNIPRNLLESLHLNETKCSYNINQLKHHLNNLNVFHHRQKFEKEHDHCQSNQRFFHHFNELELSNNIKYFNSKQEISIDDGKSAFVDKNILEYLSKSTKTVNIPRQKNPFHSIDSNHLNEATCKGMAYQYVSFYIKMAKLSLSTQALDNLVELIAKNIAQNQLESNANNSTIFNDQIFYMNLIEFLNNTNLKLVEDSE